MVFKVVDDDSHIHVQYMLNFFKNKIAGREQSQEYIHAIPNSIPMTTCALPPNAGVFVPNAVLVAGVANKLLAPVGFAVWPKRLPPVVLAVGVAPNAGK